MKKKILLVDDDFDVREYMKIIFETHNYEVEQSENIVDAEVKIKKGDIDLIVLDVMMEKDTDGFTFAQSLKNNKMYKDIPIIMVTAINQKTPFKFNIETDGSFIPVDAFIEKPVTLEKIIPIVEKLLK